jgi:metal-responsive CopG/Arc/MetJ family transcriptional regulator
MRAKYINVSIHEDLAKKIDEYMEKSKLGFRSRAEVVSEAVRRLIDKKEK